MKSHVIPENILKWARLDNMPDNALDQFIELRIDMIIDQLKQKLEGIPFEIIDTKGSDALSSV